MKVLHKYTIYLDRVQSNICINAMQCDAYTRELEFTLYSGGAEWTVPDGVSVAVAYRRADGSKGIYDTLPDYSAACAVSGNVVTAVLVPQALAVAGNTYVTVVFTDDSGKQLATFCVLLRVERNPAVGASKPEDYINLRQWMTAELAALLEEMGAIGTVWVKVTQDGTSSPTADKEYAEILASHEAGRAVYCQLPDGAVLALVVADETGVVFQGEVNREYQWVSILADGTVSYKSGKYALVGEVAKTYTVLVFPGGDGYTTEDGIDDILAACESSATVVCDVELDGEHAYLRLPLVKYNATAAYFGAVFDGKEYLVTITADGVTLEISESVGQPGADGATYTPQVVGGILYWTNNKNLGNPTPVQIQGADGADGKSAYEYAQEGGYTGTEAEFAAKLAQEIPTVPSTLPNPNALTINDQSYDGTAAVAVDTREYIVTVTGNSTDGYTADKTYGDVLAAHQAGRTVVCLFSGSHLVNGRLPLIMVTDDILNFAMSPMPGSLFMVSLSSSGCAVYESMSTLTIGDQQWDFEGDADFTDTINAMIDAKLDAIGIAEEGEY